MLQLDADVDVGYYLSGGLDSTAVSLMASKLSKKKLKTFSIVYDKNITNKKDDTFFSRKMAKYIGSDHYEFKLNENYLKDNVDKALLSFDQPFAGTITSYYLSKKISRHVKSVLTGDGADELFGSYIFPRKAEAYLKLNNINLQAEFIQKSPEFLRFLDIIGQKKMSIDEIKIDGLSISKNNNQQLLNKKNLREVLHQ
jgi:asparagine synthase (glutamine-hydrolysing)